MQDDYIIRIYGDSTSSPRYKDNVSVSETWAELIKKYFCEIYPDKNVVLYNKSQGGTIIKKMRQILINDESYYKGCDGSVFISLGIVDCGPRPIPSSIRWLLSKIDKSIRKHIIKFLHDNRTALMKIKYYKYTSEKDFRRHYKKMISKCSQYNKVFCVGVGMISDELKKRSPMFDYEIDKYNAIIKDLAEQYENCYYIDIKTALTKIKEENNLSDEELLFEDGHHYTVAGHKYVAQVVSDYIGQNIYCDDKYCAEVKPLL